MLHQDEHRVQTTLSATMSNASVPRRRYERLKALTEGLQLADVPHTTVADIDYSLMLTFLEFYTKMLMFVLMMVIGCAARL